jgi:hypothetical protein
MHQHEAEQAKQRIDQRLAETKQSLIDSLGIVAARAYQWYQARLDQRGLADYQAHTSRADSSEASKAPPSS